MPRLRTRASSLTFMMPVKFEGFGKKRNRVLFLILKSMPEVNAKNVGVERDELRREQRGLQLVIFEVE